MSIATIFSGFIFLAFGLAAGYATGYYIGFDAAEKLWRK
jgi:hypothetical protein